MAKAKVKLYEQGVGAVLKGAAMQAAIVAAAEAIADSARSQNITVGDRDGGKHEIDLPVKVNTQSTDRARATVTLAHPAGQAVQAKHGALTKAAKQAGLDVKGS